MDAGQAKRDTREGNSMLAKSLQEPRSAELVDQACKEAEASMEWWEEQWSQFPTVGVDAEGARSFWCVPRDTGCYQDDWPLGERLAEQTLTQMQRFPEGSAVLRRVLRDLDYSSTVGQGFLSKLEETLIAAGQRAP